MLDLADKLRACHAQEILQLGNRSVCRYNAGCCSKSMSWHNTRLSTSSKSHESSLPPIGCDMYGGNIKRPVSKFNEKMARHFLTHVLVLVLGFKLLAWFFILPYQREELF